MSQINRFVRFFNRLEPIFSDYERGTHWSRTIYKPIFTPNTSTNSNTQNYKNQDHFDYYRYWGGGSAFFLTLSPNLIKSKKDVFRLNGFVEYTNLPEHQNRGDPTDKSITLESPNLYYLNKYIQPKLYQGVDLTIINLDIKFIDDLINIKKKMTISCGRPIIKPYNYSLDHIKKYINYMNKNNDSTYSICYNNFKFPIIDDSVNMPIHRAHYWTWQQMDTIVHMNRLLDYIKEFNQIGQKHKISQKANLLVEIKKINPDLVPELNDKLYELNSTPELQIMFNIKIPRNIMAKKLPVKFWNGGIIVD